jgi:hypothetical protein
MQDALASPFPSGGKQCFELQKIILWRELRDVLF